MLIYYSRRKKSHLISVSDSHSCECLIWPSYTEAWNAKLHKKDKVEEIVDGCNKKMQTAKQKQTRHRFFPLQQLLPQQSSEEDHAPLTIERGTEDPTTFFKVLFPPFQIKFKYHSTQDGKRKIDFVLVFEVIQLRFRLHRSSQFSSRQFPPKGG